MIKTKKNKIKSVLSNSFKKSDKTKFYFIKGLKKYSNSLIIKSKVALEQKRLDDVRLLLRDELQNPAIDLLKWIDTVSGLIPRKNIYKIPFFDTEQIKEYSPWRICPIGEHWVRRHDRQKKQIEDVDGHRRKNPSGKNLIIGNDFNKKNFQKEMGKLKDDLIKLRDRG